MQTDYKKWLKIAAFSALLGFAPEMFAQAVFFPQEQKPGVALAEKKGEVYTIKNDLLTAQFEKTAQGKLIFKGCTQLDLLANDNIFCIELGEDRSGQDGVKKMDVLSSDMTLGEVTVKDLPADKDAATGALRFAGKEIVANYTYKANGADLTVVWHAILRDDSHYLRTKMDITANADTRMYSMIPFSYEVNNEGNKKVPATVGNTRGAVIMNDKLFAGLESPMGLNSAIALDGTEDFGNFNATSWNNAGSFAWHPTAIPEQIVKNGTIEPNKGTLNTENVVGTRGLIKIYEKGAMKITFDYTKGNHKLDVVGVELLDETGKTLLASDYHKGSTGGTDNNNIYTVNVPEANKIYQLRIYIDTASEDILSEGLIHYDKRIGQVSVVYGDGASNSVKTHPAPTASTIEENGSGKQSWANTDWTQCTGDRLTQLLYDKGYVPANTVYTEKEVSLGTNGSLDADFAYVGGEGNLEVIGVALMDGGNEKAFAIHECNVGNGKDENSVYHFDIKEPGDYKLRIYAKKNDNQTNGDIFLKLNTPLFVNLPRPKTSTIECKWRRNIWLKKDITWSVSAVVGIVAPDQARRSVACYVERERAVPWRAYPIYNSWYELNINRNNDPTYAKNMHDYECKAIVKEWQKHLYEPYGEGIEAFVWDDGWDIYGTWQFNQNFPKGFSEIDKMARDMNSGIGAWLGPVGGYGASGDFRRNYWKQENRGGMRLSNPKYYEVFYKGCTDLMVNNKYDFRYFKFDGISGQATAFGPDGGTEGEENAEGIIYAELDMRKVNPYIFFNTSVGTWASPFWFRITDTVWRQAMDYNDKDAGKNTSDRERWINYRDGLVYQHFVDESPMCPINNLMTHGFILSLPQNGVSHDQNYDGIVREMRCAFACGSGMVELYCDHALMSSIKDNNGNAGALWGELAQCIAWQKKNAEVLPDVHWVGGDPNKEEIYGWAAWNEEKKAVFSLRNGNMKEQQFTFTLREALDIPAYQTGTITLKKAFADQLDLVGFEAGKAYDMDAQITVTLPGSSVYIFDNTEEIVVPDFKLTDPATQINNRTTFTIKSEGRGYLVYNDKLDKNYLSSSFGNGDITNETPTGDAFAEQFGLVRTDSVAANEYYLYSLGARKFATPEDTKLKLTDVPLATVTLTKSGTDQFLIKFNGSELNFTNKANGGHQGVKIAGANADEGNKMTLMGVNQKAPLGASRAKIENLYAFAKLDRKGWTVTANSNHEEGKGCNPQNMLDGNLNTYWHSNYSNGGTGKQEMPYELVFDLKTPKQFCSFGYQARVNSESGVCKSYILDISNDNKTWRTVRSGELNFNGNKLAWGELGKTVEARYVRLTIASNQANNALACMSEFYLGYDGAEVDNSVIYNLPLFSVEEAPKWYPVYFKNGGAYLQDMGAGQKMMTKAKADTENAQKWQFIGNENDFVMKSGANNYVTFKDSRFQTTSKKSEATALSLVQGEKWFLQIKVKGSSQCMNQFGGAGTDKELAEYTNENGGNILQMFDITIPDPSEMPLFSTDQQTTWYMLQFKEGNLVMDNKGEGKEVRLANATLATTQLWKLVGDRNKFQIVSHDGKYMEVSDVAAENVGNAPANAHPLRVSANEYAHGFKLVGSQNANHATSWEIAPNDPQFNSKTFNQHGGTKVDYTIAIWNSNANDDKNNPLQFVEVGVMDIATAEGYGTFYADKAFTMPAGVKGTSVSAASAEGVLTTPWEYAEGSKVPANTALLVKHEVEPKTYFFGFTNEKVAAATGTNLLKGAVKDAQTEGEGCKFYKLTYDQSGANLGFYWSVEGGAAFTSKGGKAYLAVPAAQAAGVQGFRLDGTMTGIEGVEAQSNGVSAVYNLAGVRVSNNLKQLPKGVYIVNGKKVIIK